MDLNADLGEGFGSWRLTDDDALLDIVTSANVACGFHAGDPSIMRSVCAAAAARGVAVGAQVSYRDLAGFGRRYMAYEPAELEADVLYQIAALDGIARAEGTAVSYVKPHGALYHAVVDDPVQAGAVLAAVRAFPGALPVLCLPGSALLGLAADAGVRGWREAFLDRGYRPDGRLVPRGEPGALLDDPDEVAARAVRLAVSGSVVAVDGSVVAVDADSLCLHGDSATAVSMGRKIVTALRDANINLAPAAFPRS